MEHLKMQSRDLVSDNIQFIAERWPNCLTERLNAEGKLEVAIDFDKLRQELSKEIVEGPEERYQFTWPDKRNAIRLANAPTTDTLRPVLEDETTPTGADSNGKSYCSTGSVDFDTTQNLYIEGDNLQVLKLLRENYLGKVKMIYIDPPYNTGNDFVYNDDFAQSADEYANNSGQTDEEGNRLVANTESNGRFHTDWLNMIYPRLKVARDLLSEDGVIFISIDENEITNMRKVCDEIFGSPNFVDCLHWKKKKQPSFLAKHTAKVMEYVVVYAKHFYNLEKLSIETLSDATKKVINISNPECIRHFKAGVRVKIGDEGILRKGRYRIKTMDVEYMSDVRYKNGVTIEDVDVLARFSVSQDKIDSFIDNNLLFITANSGLRRDVSAEETQNRKAITDLLLNDYGDNQESDKEFMALFEAKYFDYTKPIKLVYNLIKSNLTEGQVVLDFFSGSATTAHAVMELNAEDGGNRKFIMVQLPELTDEKSEAYKAGFKNICEIGKERIRRAGKKIKEESPLTTQDLDTGFRVLKLDSSNMEDVFYTPAETTEQTLFSDNIKPDRTDEDLLFQVMLELGILLSDKIEKTEVAGKTVWNVGEGYLMACFEENVNEDTIKAIAKQKPAYFVMADRSLESDNVADNFEQLFEEYSPETIRRIL